MHIQDIITDYNKGLGTNKLAQKYNIHRSTVQRILKRHNITLRKKSPSFSYDTSFFSRYNNESCYWAGFILADGCIRHSRNLLSIKLSIIDINHLEKFKRVINYSGNVHTNQEQTYAYIDVCGKWFKEDLINNFGITPRKTKTIEFSEKIPTEFYSSFIRGIFDGDGCVTHYTTKSNNKKYLCINMLGTIPLLDHIRTSLYELVGIEKRTPTKLPKISNRSGVCCISYAYHNSVKILNWMYKSKTENTYLTRKFIKSKELQHE